MIDLNDLRVFEKVAFLQSFTDAARSLGIPKSSASRSVVRLESTVGARLLQRSSRDVALTEIGSTLLQRCTGIMHEVGETLNLINRLNGLPCGVLKIGADSELSAEVLPLLLPSFLERHPDVSVCLDAVRGPTGLVQQGLDILVQLGPLPDSSLVGVTLGYMDQVLCASPAYLARKGTPVCPEDLSAHDLISVVNDSTCVHDWAFVDQEGHEKSLDMSLRLRVADSATAYHLIANGAGVGRASRLRCGDDIRSGRLIELLTAFALQPVRLGLLFTSRRDISPAARAFVDFMKERDSLSKWCSRPGKNEDEACSTSRIHASASVEQIA